MMWKAMEMSVMEVVTLVASEGRERRGRGEGRERKDEYI